VARIEMLLHFAKTGAFPPTRKLESWLSEEFPAPPQVPSLAKGSKVEFPLRIQAHS
jgi:hypothetical protein